MKPEKNTLARWKEKHESEISQVREIIHAGKRSHLTIAGLVIVLALVVTAIFAPLLAPYDPLQMDLRNRLQAPSAQHWMGTDELGRDIFSRILHGTGLALKIMIIVLLIDLPLGMLLGIVAGRSNYENGGHFHGLSKASPCHGYRSSPGAQSG
jgi:peptide/nickel transport system permease protein